MDTHLKHAMKRTVYHKKEGILVLKPKLEPLFIKNVDVKLTKGKGMRYSQFESENTENNFKM
jgi:hypothetical protein